MKLPDVREYKSHILKTICFLDGNYHVNAHCVEMSHSVKRLRSSLEKSGPQDWVISTSPQWIIPLDWPAKFGTRSAKLAVGANIRVASGNLTEHVVSFSIITKETVTPQIQAGTPCCLREYAFTPRVVRHVHFEVDTASSGVARPRCHFQVGGQLPQAAGYADCHYCSDAYIDEPRSPTSPTDLVLLLDMLLRQFQTPLHPSLTEDRVWKGLVTTSEALWLKSYFGEVSIHLSKTVRGTFYEKLCEPAIT